MPNVNTARERVARLQPRRVSEVGAGRPAYVSAPAVSGGGELEQIASSLGALNPRLERFAAQKAEKRVKAEAKQKKDKEALAQQTLAGMTLEEVNKSIADGTLTEYENPYFRAATDKIRGVRQAREESRDIERRIASGELDPLSDDFEAIITGQSEGTLEGASGHFVSGYHATMFKERERLLEVQNDAKIVATEKDRAASAHTALRDVILQGTPEEAVANLAIAKGEIKGSLKLSFSEMDELTLSIAEEIALTGDHSRVEAILKTKRTGSNGEDLGSISSKKGYGAKAETLIQRAKNIKAQETSERDYATLMEYDDLIASGNVTIKDIREDTRLKPADQRSLSNQLRQADARRLKAAQDQAKELREEQALKNMEIMATRAINSGNGAFLDDMSITVGDKEIKMTRKEAMQFGLNTAVTQRLAALDKQYGGEVPPGVKEAAVQKLVNQNGTTYKPWENLLNSAGSIATFANTAGGEGFPPQLTQAFQLYKNIDRTTAEHHLKDDGSRKLLRAAYVAEKYMGMPPESALQHAITVRESQITGQAGVREKQVMAAINKVDLKSWFPGEGPKENFAGFARRDITEIASQIAASTGVATDVAVEEAAEIYTNTHVLVNGGSVRIPEGFTKGQFKETANGFLKAWHDKFNKDAFGGNNSEWGARFEDINMRTMDGGKTFQIFDGITPLGPRHTYSADNFRRFMAEDQANQDGKKLDKAVEKAERLKKSRQRVEDTRLEGPPSVPSLLNIR